MELRDKDVSAKMLKRVLPLLEKLHGIGVARDTAGNRRLFFDDYTKLVLLWLLNPLITSVAALHRAAQLPKLARQLGIADFSRASFSEAPAVFEPEALQEVIRELAGQLQALPRDPRLAQIRQVITLADGTLLRALPKLLETLCRPNRNATPHHAWRLHTLFDLERGVPVTVRLTSGNQRGPNNERKALGQMLEADRLYVCDRGYYDRPLMSRIVTTGSSYVCRVRDDAVYEPVEERPLTPEDQEQGILSDQVVRMQGLDHPTRLIRIEADVHTKRTRNGYRQSSGCLLVMCNELEMQAWLIAVLYQYRWSIETFFAFFKQTLGCRHLLNQRRQGVEIQVYCAVIVCMLLNLWTGIRPAKAVMEVITWYLLGFADEQDVLRQVEKTRLEQEKARLKKLER